MTHSGQQHHTVAHSFPQTFPLLLPRLCSYAASILWVDKGPVIKTAPCPPPVARSSSSQHTGEGNQMASYEFNASSLTLVKPPHAVSFHPFGHFSESLRAFWEEIKHDWIPVKFGERRPLIPLLFWFELSLCVFVRKRLAAGKSCVRLVVPSRADTLYIYMAGQYASLPQDVSIKKFLKESQVSTVFQKQETDPDGSEGLRFERAKKKKGERQRRRGERQKKDTSQVVNAGTYHLSETLCEMSGRLLSPGKVP